MNRYRSSTLNLFVRHCPRALRFHMEQAPRDRSVFEVGVAAHAFLEQVGQESRQEGRQLPWLRVLEVAERTALLLMCNGREFDGVREPPLSPEAVIEGRDIALRWLERSPLSPHAEYERQLGIDEHGRPATQAARYVAAMDAIERTEIGDEESAYRAVVISEWKTAWPTNANELDTLQCRGHAVIAAAHFAGDVDVIVQRVVNLRTRQVFERTLDLEADRDTIDRWRRDILLVCTAADETREARPGAGCLGCPYVADCPDAWGAAAHDEATGLLAAQALRDDLHARVKAMCAERTSIEVAGGVVGYVEREERIPRADIHRQLAHAWFGAIDEDEFDAQHAQWLGLLAALKLGVTSAKAATWALFPGRENKLAREDLIGQCVEAVPVARFVVERKEEAA